MTPTEALDNLLATCLEKDATGISFRVENGKVIITMQLSLLKEGD